MDFSFIIMINVIVFHMTLELLWINIITNWNFKNIYYKENVMSWFISWGV